MKNTITKPTATSLPVTPHTPDTSSAVPSAKRTPMQQQYFKIKGSLPGDTLLLFRLGDFTKCSTKTPPSPQNS
ncbi:hypothetical protein OH491_24695 [Termitidicoccus mucosus]|uniref:hypothetical protein n=1 Tax=Termitidicoccus mucosus TaxID=1184151 RepID=UPI002684E912